MNSELSAPGENLSLADDLCPQEEGESFASQGEEKLFNAAGLADKPLAELAPDTPHDYNLAETLKGESLDAGFLEAMAGRMHGLGLSVGQAQKLALAYQDELKNLMALEGVKHQAELKELKSSWGRDYQKLSAKAQMAASRFGFSREELKAVEQAFGPKFMLEKLARIGEMLTEDAPVFGASGQSDFALGPEAAKSRLQELLGDADFSRRYLAGDKEALNKIARLSRLAA